MGDISAFLHPVIFLAADGEFTGWQNTFSLLQTNRIRNFPEFIVIGNMVFELPAGAKRHGVDYNMVVEIVCIQMGGDYDFIISAPHSSGSFQTDFVSLLRGDLSGAETLKSVVRHIPTQFSVSAFGCRHIRIGLLRGPVDGGNKHLLVSLVIVFRIAECLVEIVIQKLSIYGFIWIFSMIDDLF